MPAVLRVVVGVVLLSIMVTTLGTALTTNAIAANVVATASLFVDTCY